MSKFKKFFFPVLIILITVLICFLNYTPNTFLTGWDTLHPELNFSLNFKRLLNLWHSEQGLGTIPAHAQISDLPRVFILYLFHFVLPLNFLRYSYIFLCFILGPLGIYFLIKNLFINYKSNFISLISSITALLYIFNLSTVQQFYVPFEMFPTQWAFLPWIILFSLKYLKNNKRQNLILFAIFTFLATPQAYAPQLWYAFFFTYALFLLIYSWVNKNFKNSKKLLLFTLLLNAFWLIPNLFYIFTSSLAPKLNRDNRLYSQEYLYKNRANGYISDSALIKGFYIDWSIYNFSQKSFTKLMPQWQNHFNNPLTKSIGYIIFAISLLGLIISFLKKDKLLISFSPFFIIPFILLSNRLPIFSQFFDFLIQNSTIRESFRFIFTKLSILQIFGFVIFFSYALNFLFSKIKSLKIVYLISFITISSIIFYCYPILTGNLISSKVKINIPSEYFNVWNFMNSQDNGRVLSLPLNQSSGWQYYDWEYQGSGFLWFNLKQNLLDRDSDRWSNQNEQSYKEFFNSLYSQNSQQFFQTLQKYNINYLIWDQNIINPSAKNNDQITFKNEIDSLLNQLQSENKIELIYQKESLYIYKTNIPSFFSKIQEINNFIQPSYQWGYFDSANSSDYLTDNQKGTFYPFRNVINTTQKIDTNKLDIKNIDNQWQITLKNNDRQSFLPSINITETLIPVNVFLQTNQKSSTKIIFQFPLPQEIISTLKTEFETSININNKVRINDQEFSFDQKKSDLQYLGNVNIFVNSNNFLNDKIIDFKLQSTPSFYLNNISIKNSSLDYFMNKEFNSLNNIDNYTLDLSSLPHSFGYIIAIKSQYISGIPLRLCLQNEYSFLCSIEDEVSKNKTSDWDYFLVPSTGENIGYNLSINNISYGNFSSKSLLENVSIIPIPFNLLSQIKSETPNINIDNNNWFILNQSYNKFWLAFYFDNLKPVFLSNHILYNNWANAWKIPSSYDLTSNIYILFWPQIFEFIGIGLTITTLIWSFKRNKR